MFATAVFVVGLMELRSLNSASAADIVALAAAVLGVVGTHVGHVAGHELATKRTTAERLATGIERLAALHAAGTLTPAEFETAKAKLLAD